MPPAVLVVNGSVLIAWSGVSGALTGVLMVATVVSGPRCRGVRPGDRRLRPRTIFACRATAARVSILLLVQPVTALVLIGVVVGSTGPQREISAPVRAATS